jgi:hypothetical protein
MKLSQLAVSRRDKPRPKQRHARLAPMLSASDLPYFPAGASSLSTIRLAVKIGQSRGHTRVRCAQSLHPFALAALACAAALSWPLHVRFFDWPNLRDHGERHSAKQDIPPRENTAVNTDNQKPSDQQQQEPAPASSKANEGQDQERPLNSYELKQEARRERFEDAADRAAQASDSTFARAREMASVIPFGQPILVGHHSEGRDRRYRGRISSTYEKSFQLQDKAKHYENKAASVGKGGVSSDDPDAIEKLRRQLVTLEQLQDRMKAGNKVIKSKYTPEAKTAALIVQGFTEAQATQLQVPDFCGRIGFASYQLTNNNANIRRIRERIEQIESSRTKNDVEAEGKGYTYREDVEENRAMFEFPGKPVEAIRSILKQHAFKWSPTRGAWVRQLTNSARYAAACVRQAIDALSLDAPTV